MSTDDGTDFFDLFGETGDPPSDKVPSVESGSTLEESIEYVMSNLDDGVRCPCCAKYARRYRRTFNSTMARSLIWLVREWFRLNKSGWVDVPKVGPRWMVKSNQLPTVRWWGMVERPSDSGDSALKHSGLWRPTELGVRFAMRHVRVLSKAVTYDGEVEGLEGVEISVVDALGKKFDYSELMGL